VALYIYIYTYVYMAIYIYIAICKSVNFAPDRQIGKFRPKAGNERFHKEKYQENDRFLKGVASFRNLALEALRPQR